MSNRSAIRQPVTPRAARADRPAPPAAGPPAGGLSGHARNLAAAPRPAWRTPANRLRDEDFFDPAWESILQRFDVDCRVISYDQFCRPPEQALLPGARIDWWNALSRSTPNRMWRQELPDGTSRDIWGHVIRIVNNPTGAYEEFAVWPLAARHLGRRSQAAIPGRTRIGGTSRRCAACWRSYDAQERVSPAFPHRLGL